MTVVAAGFGFLMSIAGRPFYAFFVGGAGFLLGRLLVARYPVITPVNWSPVILPLIFSVAIASTVFLVKRWAARVAGFMAGGYLLYELPVTLGSPVSWGSPVLFAIAGAVCFVLLLVWFDFALIAISSVLGATLISQALRASSLDPIFLFLILMVFGLITQFLLMQYIRLTPD